MPRARANALDVLNPRAVGYVRSETGLSRRTTFLRRHGLLHLRYAQTELGRDRRLHVRSAIHGAESTIGGAVPDIVSVRQHPGERAGGRTARPSAWEPDLCHDFVVQVVDEGDDHYLIESGPTGRGPRVGEGFGRWSQGSHHLRAEADDPAGGGNRGEGRVNDVDPGLRPARPGGRSVPSDGGGFFLTVARFPR